MSVYICFLRQTDKYIKIPTWFLKYSIERRIIPHGLIMGTKISKFNVHQWQRWGKKYLTLFVFRSKVPFPYTKEGCQYKGCHPISIKKRVPKDDNFAFGWCFFYINYALLLRLPIKFTLRSVSRLHAQAGVVLVHTETICHLDHDSVMSQCAKVRFRGRFIRFCSHISGSLI